MSKEATIWIVIAIYAIFMVVIGVVNSKNSGGMASFTVGGRNAGAWISALVLRNGLFFRGNVYRLFRRLGLELWTYGAVLVGVGNAVFGSLLAWLVSGKAHPGSHAAGSKSNPCPSFLKCGIRATSMKLFSCDCDFHLFCCPIPRPSIKGLTSVCSILLNIDEQVCMIMIAVGIRGGFGAGRLYGHA